MASFRLHYVVPAPSGPIVSDGGPQLPLETQGVLGERPGKPGTYQVACDPKLTLTGIDRGTDRTYLVACPACKATDVYKATYRPHPRDVVEDGEAETETNPLRR